MEDLERLKQVIVEGEAEQAEQLSRSILDSGYDAMKAIQDAVIPGINEAGMLWEKNQYFIPDVIMSSDAFNAAMTVLKSQVPAHDKEPTGKYVICTVKGDIHTLGKSIVVTMLEAAGFDVIDLGEDVPVQTFIDKVREVQPDIVGLGAYMSTTASTIREYITALEESGLRSGLKVMVGGVRTSEKYAKELGADAWGKNGLDTAEKATKLLGV